MGSQEAQRDVQHVLWRAVMFILALVGIGVNALIFVILGGHGHSHHGHSHDHGHAHGHEHSHGKGSGCNGHRVRPWCPPYMQLAALCMYTWISCQVMNVGLQPSIGVCPGLTP